MSDLRVKKMMIEVVENCDERQFIEEDSEQDDVWHGISRLRDVGYEAIDKMKYAEMTESWLSAWDKIKVLVKNAYKKPAIMDVDEATDFEYEIYNWFQDIEMELGNAKEHDKRIVFCHEVIDLFDWEVESPNNYMAAIGEALNDVGRIDESNEWFDNWLKNEPGNPYCINIYVWCLVLRNDLDKAKELLEKTITLDMECTMDNEMLFHRAEGLYEVIGDVDKAKSYKEKIEAFHKNSLKISMMYRNADEMFDSFYDQQPVVKEKKIYPNDPCPCGSGKKYKKCCANKKVR